MADLHRTATRHVLLTPADGGAGLILSAGCVLCFPVLQEKYIDGEVQERHAGGGGQEREGAGGAGQGQGGGAQAGGDEGEQRGGDSAPEGYKWARGSGKGSRTGAEATT